jgi:hypothetical protein
MQRSGTLLAFVLLLGASDVDAQLVTVGLGALVLPSNTFTVFELHAAGPPYLADFRPYTTISWTDANLSDKPTVIVAAERQYLFVPPKTSGLSSSIGPGFVMLPITDYRPEFQLTNSLVVFLPIPRTALVILASWQPFDPDDWAIVVKLGLTLWSGK